MSVSVQSAIAASGLDELGNALLILAVVFAFVALIYVVPVVYAMVALARRWVGRVPWDARPLAASIIAVLLHAPAVTSAGMVELLNASRGVTIIVPVVLAALSAAGLVGARKPSLRIPAHVLALVLASGAAAEVIWLTHPDVFPTKSPGSIVSVSGTMFNSCAAYSSGHVVCAGTGALGPGKNPDGPVLIEDVDDAVSVVVSPYTGCAIRRRGDVACWGNESPPPSRFGWRGAWKVPGSDGVVGVTIAAGKVIGRRADGTMFGWPEPPPKGWEKAKSLVGRRGDTSWADTSAACIELDSGVVSCVWWKGTVVDAQRDEPALAGAVSIAPGRDRSACGVLANGKLVCVDEHDRIAVVPNVDDAVQVIGVDGSSDTFCVRARDGAVTCWTLLVPDNPKRSMSARGELQPVGPYYCVTGDGPIACADERGTVVKPGPGSWGSLGSLLALDR